MYQLDQMEIVLHELAKELKHPERAKRNPAIMLQETAHELSLYGSSESTYECESAYILKEDTVVFGGLSAESPTHSRRIDLPQAWKNLEQTRAAFLKGRISAGFYMEKLSAFYYCVLIGLHYLGPVAKSFNRVDAAPKLTIFDSSQQRETVRAVSLKLETAYKEFIKQYLPATAAKSFCK